MTEEEASLLILQFLRDRLGMGLEESGLYNYYSAQSKRDSAFNGYDLGIADFIVARAGLFSKYVEVGAGIGALSILLAIRGFKTIALEGNRFRYRALCELLNLMADRIDPLPETVFSRFPQASDSSLMTRDTLGIFTNLITSEQGLDERMLDTSVNCGGLIIDLARFDQSRTMPDTWQELSNKVQSRGFEMPEPVWSIGEPSVDPAQRNCVRIVYFHRRQ